MEREDEETELLSLSLSSLFRLQHMSLALDNVLVA